MPKALSSISSTATLINKLKIKINKTWRTAWWFVDPPANQSAHIYWVPCKYQPRAEHRAVDDKQNLKLPWPPVTNILVEETAP
jgi:hypothetical protein